MSGQSALDQRTAVHDRGPFNPRAIRKGQTLRCEGAPGAFHANWHEVAGHPSDNERYSRVFHANWYEAAGHTPENE